MARIKILVVDDDPGIQLLLKKRLETEGYDVILAGDGLAGLEKVVAYRPDCILFDLVMPKMSGIEFLKMIKKIKGAEKLPLIVISKHITMKDCFDEGTIEGFFEKPFDMAALLEKIKVVTFKSKLFEVFTVSPPKNRERSGSSGEMREETGKVIYICERCERKLVSQVDFCPFCGSSVLSPVFLYH